jgi:hypothetical protein
LNFKIYLDDTWKWDGSDWTQYAPANTPSERYEHAMAYDMARGVVVLFGGDGNSGLLNDTWEWNGENWTLLSPAQSPTARSEHAMVYDSKQGVIILFGGKDGSGDRNDTWQWDGTNWTQHSPDNKPGARNSHAMVYDIKRDAIVLFGGWQEWPCDPYICINIFNDTWEYIAVSEPEPESLMIFLPLILH